jgi:hypothetical protein
MCVPQLDEGTRIAPVPAELCRAPAITDDTLTALTD